MTAQLPLRHHFILYKSRIILTFHRKPQPPASSIIPPNTTITAMTITKILVIFGATGQQGGSVADYVLNDPELSMFAP